LAKKSCPGKNKDNKGYLLYILCDTNGKDPAGNDLTKNPEKTYAGMHESPRLVLREGYIEKLNNLLTLSILGLLTLKT
jgi:hypothetical protein